MRRTAKVMRVVPRTLRRWRASWRRDRLKVKPRGRPVVQLERRVRQAVVMVLAFLGPEVGLPTLEWIFPQVTRSALSGLLRRYRRLAHLEVRAMLHVLQWHRVGAVWAVDFSTPPLPIDGLYRHLFHVRDLASGRHLLTLPVFDESANTVIAALESLKRWCGIPLVLKLDNGGGFIAPETRAWAEANGVHLMYSPPQTPSYNGGVEAGNGSIETRAYHHAARNGRPWEWTCDDVECARLQANAIGRPHGRNGPTPDEAWERLEPLRDDERLAFAEAYRAHEAEERRQRQVPEGVRLQRQEQASIDRVALGRTLIELGFLSIRRRRITPRIPKRKADRFS